MTREAHIWMTRELARLVQSGKKKLDRWQASKMLTITELLRGGHELSDEQDEFLTALYNKKTELKRLKY